MNCQEIISECIMHIRVQMASEYQIDFCFKSLIHAQIQKVLCFSVIYIFVTQKEQFPYKTQHHMVSEDQIRLITGMLVLVPLSYFIRSIRGAGNRILYCNVIAIALQVWVFRHQMIGIYVQSAIVFLLIKFCRSRYIGTIVMVESMLFLEGYHIHEVLYNYGGWSMSGEALMMILVCKYSFLAYSVQDSFLEAPQLSEERRNFKVDEDIQLSDFLGYINFLPTSLIGPPIEYKLYRDFIYGQPPFHSLPSPTRDTLVSVGQSLLCAGVYLAGEIYFPVTLMRTGQFYEESSWLWALAFTLISVTLVRFKYYFGWKLIIAAVHSSGASFSQKSGRFDAVSSCTISVVETDKHVRSKIAHWNTAVQEWFRKAVYQRSPFANRSVSQLWVFMVSAVWHGFYPGYYIAFFFWFVQLYTQGEIFRFFKDVKVPSSRLVRVLMDISLTLLVNTAFSYAGALFFIMEFEYCLLMSSKVYHLPELTLLVLAVTFTILNMGKKKRAPAVANAQKQKKED